MSKITWDGNNRELKKSEIDIIQYYKNLTENWNKLSDYIKEPTDRRTKHYKIYSEFFHELLYMWDMIKQTQEQYETLIYEKNEQIQLLERKLDKWTDQQQGRKPKLTSDQKDQVLKWKKMELSNREIAENLGVSEGTIRNFLKSF